MRTLYDGQSFDIIRENEVFGESARAPSLVIGEDVTDGQNANEQTRFTGTKVALYANGENVGVNRSASNGDSSGRAYFGTDILGSVRSATTDTGAIEDRYEYDAFGTPYKGDFDNGLGNGYTGKPYDSTTGLYNYGFRDYNPQTARFTTVDPIRDGNNWFSYVVNDPVNYVDLWGLECSPTDETAKEDPSDEERFPLMENLLIAGTLAVSDTALPIGDVIGLGFLAFAYMKYKADSKAKVNVVTQEELNESNGIRIQVQTGVDTLATTGKIYPPGIEGGVIKAQGYAGLQAIFNDINKTILDLEKVRNSVMRLLI